MGSAPFNFSYSFFVFLQQEVSPILTPGFTDESFEGEITIDDIAVEDVDDLIETEGNFDRGQQDERDRYLSEFNPRDDLRIGDVQLPIPPESISISTTNQVAAEPSDVLRSQTQKPISAGHNLRQIRFSFKVSGPEQINGTIKEAEDVTGEPIEIITNTDSVIQDGAEPNTVTPQYYINGLRALLAQFKVAPFLPIENYKINNENNIDAVTLHNITVTNVDQMPETLEVQCVFMEFNYQAYVDTVQPFKSIFNWDLFRFHYQRLLEGTKMEYDRGAKFPIIDSIDSQHFNVDVVERQSLEEHEEAVNFLSNVPRFVEDVTLYHEEGNFWASVEDKDAFLDAQKQYNMFNNLKDNMVAIYQNNPDHPLDGEGAINSFAELYEELVEVTQEKYDNFNVPIGVAENLPDHRMNGYSLMEEYKDWVENSEELENNEMYFVPFFAASSRNIDGYSEDLHIFEFTDSTSPLYSTENAIYIETARRHVVHGTMEEAEEHGISWGDQLAGDIDHDQDYFNYRIVPWVFHQVKDNIIETGKDNEEMYKKARDTAEAAWKDYDYHNVDFENLYIQDISVSYMNDLITQNISMQTRPAHQYLGSKEIKISLEAIVNSDEEIQKLNYLLEHSQELTNRYNEILEGPVLKLNNSIAQLFGLDGVYIENVNDETIPNFPGARAVQVTFLGYWHSSHDIETLTTRYRTKATDLLSQGTEAVATPGEGMATDDEIQSYMELKEELKEINLYPDLELPQHNELPVNYHEEFEVDLENTTYVDPDYYALNINHLFVEEAMKVTDEESYETGDMSMADVNDYYGLSEITAGGEVRETKDPDEPSQGTEVYQESDWPAKYFSEEEFENAVGMTAQDTVHPWEKADLNTKARQLLFGLDVLQHAIGTDNNIVINHSARSEHWNTQNGGADNSKHLARHWHAADITVPGMSPEQLMQAVEDLNLFTGRGLYLPEAGNFIHVDTRNGMTGEEGEIIRWYNESGSNIGAADGRFGGHLDGVNPLLRKDDRQKIAEEIEDTQDAEEVDKIEESDEVPDLRDSTKDILKAGKKISNNSYFSDGETKDPDSMFDLMYDILYDIDRRTDKSLKHGAKRHASILTSFALSDWNDDLSYTPEHERVNEDIDHIPTRYKLRREGAYHFDIPAPVNNIFQVWATQNSGDTDTNRDYLENNLTMQVAAMAAAANEAYTNVYDMIEDYEPGSGDNYEIETAEGGYMTVPDPSDKSTNDNIPDDLLKLYFAYMFAEEVGLDDMAEMSDNFDEKQKGFAEAQKQINDATGNPRDTTAFSNEEADKIGSLSRMYAEEAIRDGAVSKEDFGDFDFEEGEHLINLRSKEERYRDTFHDMFRYDKRGRLLRAFPTYYLMLIDESDDYFIWRMQDLFYDYQGVESLNVVRDKDNIADVCHIQMSDTSNVLSDATGGHKDLDIEHGFFQTIISTINPFSDFNDEVASRAVDAQSVELQTGARIHLRMGYGSSPDQLPTIFNGRITELELGPQVQVVAQNDAIELNRPFTDVGPKETSADITGGWVDTIAGDHWFESVHEPTQLITALYDYEDGFFSWVARRVSGIQEDLQKSVWGREPEHDFRSFGSFTIPQWWENNSQIMERHNFFQPEVQKLRDTIYKFGDWKHEFPLNFEIAQNTYMVRDLSSTSVSEDDLLMEINMYGKTPWETLQTCAMAAPNYIAEIHPFGIGRSTIFYGHPSFDLAYDYSLERAPTQPAVGHEAVQGLADTADSVGENDPRHHELDYINRQRAQRDLDEAVENMEANFESQGDYVEVSEDLKTFRQMRVYGSYQDIIANEIMAIEGFPTSVEPVVSDSGGDVENNDALYLDADIKPEYQHQVQVDTSVNVGHPVTRFNNQWLPFYDTGAEEVADEIAADALAQHVRDMYQGQLSVMGDPTVKPYDYSYLYDLKEQMNGFFEVNTVVHSMDKQQGFMTNIQPDPIVFKNSGGRADGEYLMWAQSRVHEVYRTYFMTRAMLLTLMGSDSILAKANLSNLLLGTLKSGAHKMGTMTAAKMRAINEGIEQLAAILDNKANLALKGGWQNYAQAFGQKLETARSGTAGALKYIKKATGAGPTQSLAKAGNHLTDLATGSSMGAGAVQGKKGAALYAIGNKLKGASANLALLTTNPAALGIKMVASWLIVDRIQEWLDSFRRSQKTPLTIMLLNKNGHPFEAGIDGAKRAVVGENPDSFVYDFLFDNAVFNFFAGTDEQESQTQALQQQLAESQDVFDESMSEMMQQRHKDLYQEAEAALRDEQDLADTYAAEIDTMYRNTVWNEPEEEEVDIDIVGPEETSTPVGDFEQEDREISDRTDDIEYEPDVDYEAEDMEPEDIPKQTEEGAPDERDNNIRRELEHIVSQYGAPRGFESYGSVDLHPELYNKLKGIEVIEQMTNRGLLDLSDSPPAHLSERYSMLYDKGVGLKMEMDEELYENRLEGSPEENPFASIVEHLRWNGVKSFIIKGNEMHIDLGREMMRKDK